MSSLFKNFSRYAEFGGIPSKSVGYCGNRVPQNSFYKSVHYINSVVGPVKNVAFSESEHPSLTYVITYVLASIVLQPLYLALAYLSYWPATSKRIGKSNR